MRQFIPSPLAKFYLAWGLFGSLVPATIYAQDANQDGVRPRAVSVQSLALQEVGPWGAGALPEELAPLSSDLWRGGDPATLGLVFGKITPDQRFPSLQGLTRQAIFSGGAAPTTDPDVSRARFEAANRFGPAEATARLIFAIPRLATDPELVSLAIDAGLRVGRNDEACSLIEAVAAPASGTAWLEARATCYALNNEGAAANLSVDLARSRGLTDTWLGRAIAAVAGPLTAPPPFRLDSGRALALSLRAKLKPPIALSTTQDPIALSALVNTPEFMASLPPEERLALARNGASRGVVSSAIVASAQLSLEPDLTVAALPSPAQISQKLKAAQTLTLRAFEARAALSELKSIMATQPGLMTLADVPLLTEAALWARDGALASSIAALSPETLDARLGLVLALYDPSSGNQALERRLNEAGNDPVARRVALRDLVVAWSAGLPTRDGVSLLVQTGLPWAPAGNSGLRTALDLAAGRGSKGETILLTALATQGVDPSNVDPETLIGAIKALRRVGLDDAARDLARDYLLANFVTLPVRTPIRPTVRPPVRPPARPNARPIAQPGVGPNAPTQAPSPPAPSPPAPSAAASRPPAPRLETARPVVRLNPAVQAPTARIPTQPRNPTNAPATTPRKPTWGTP